MEDKLQEYLNGVLDSLAEAVDRVFNDTSLYNTSYWNTFIHTLLFDISGGLVVRRGHVRSEAEVRYNLINPLLKHVVNSIIRDAKLQSLVGKGPSFKEQNNAHALCDLI